MSEESVFETMRNISKGKHLSPEEIDQFVKRLKAMPAFKQTQEEACRVLQKYDDAARRSQQITQKDLDARVGCAA